MAIEVEEGLLDYLAASTGAVHLELRGAHDAATATAAMRRAREAIFSIPHPEEPDDPLPSFASGVTMGARGPSFWFDIADAQVYDGLLEQGLETVVHALEREGATGRLASSLSP